MQPQNSDDSSDVPEFERAGYSPQPHEALVRPDGELGDIHRGRSPSFKYEVDDLEHNLAIGPHSPPRLHDRFDPKRDDSLASSVTPDTYRQPDAPPPAPLSRSRSPQREQTERGPPPTQRPREPSASLERWDPDVSPERPDEHFIEDTTEFDREKLNKEMQNESLQERLELDREIQSLESQMDEYRAEIERVKQTPLMEGGETLRDGLISKYQQRIENIELQLSDREDQMAILHARQEGLETLRQEDMYGPADTSLDPLVDFNYDWAADEIAREIAFERGEYFEEHQRRYKIEMLEIMQNMDDRARFAAC